MTSKTIFATSRMAVLAAAVSAATLLRTVRAASSRLASEMSSL